MKSQEKFTKYEIARILGARALQIAMDAPLLCKMSEEGLKALKYDAIKIAEVEFESNVLPISVNRPTPKKQKEKTAVIKEEKVSDEKIIEKEQELEKEITADAEQLGLIPGDETEDYVDEPISSKTEEQ